ncbi:MAG: response regulator transcription factor [Bacteroidia bacterium]|nr:response regulator transcription factor [Bacteroidia bacterium]
MMRTNNITILIADDHPMFRRGLKESIEEIERFQIVAECQNGAIALEKIRLLRPQITILDMEMPQMGGLDVALHLQREELHTGLIFLTVHDDEAMFRRAMDLGARGYILKEAVVNEIVQGIEVVADGDFYISPLLSSRLLQMTRNNDGNVASQAGLSNLTPAERRILKLIAEELSTDEIADKLCVSPRTVEHHRSNMNHKLGLSGSYALVRFALKNAKLL